MESATIILPPTRWLRIIALVGAAVAASARAGDSTTRSALPEGGTSPTSAPVMAQVGEGQDVERRVERSYFAVAIARAHAELALRQSRDFFDASASLPGAAMDAATRAQTHAADLILAAQANEQNRPPADRSSDLLDELRRQSEALVRQWSRFIQVEAPSVRARYTADRQTMTDLSAAFAALVALENLWKQQEIDLSGIERAYGDFIARTERNLADAREALNAMREQQLHWETVMHKLTESVGPHAADKPTGAPAPL